MPPTPKDIVITDTGCPLVAAQLTGPGPGGAGIRHYAVAGAIADGHRSPLEIAYLLQVTVAQVWISLRWLNRQGFLLLVFDQVQGLTLSGKRALTARTKMVEGHRSR